MPGLVLRDAVVGGAHLDVRVEAGRIAAIGQRLAEEGAEPIDLGGRTLLRGLWDEHVHVTQAAVGALWTPLGAAASAVEALSTMAAAAEGIAPDEPLIGIGYQDGLWPDRPTVAAIDALAGERIVVLISHDVHAAWLSSVAARRFGVQAGIDGVVREAPAFAVGQAVNALAAERTEEAIRSLMRRAGRRGVTGIVDLEMTWSRDAWRERMAGEWTGPRIEAGVYPPDLDRAEATGLHSGEAVPGTGGLLAVGPLKALVDGALNTRTAFCVDPYPSGDRGRLEIPPEVLRGLLDRARRAGLTPAIHAIGDAAVTVALDAFQAAGVGGRIEHAQLVADTDLPRFASLGVTASVQPAHLLDDRAVAAEHWPGRTRRAYPFRALLDAGATLAFGSDAPVAGLDPWLAIRAAVERARPGEQAWHPEQRIALTEALAASTRGRVVPRVGDMADLIALDAPVEQPGADPVALTLVAGRPVHSTFFVV